MGRCYDDICRFLRTRGINFLADADRTECWANLGIREGIRMEVSLRAMEQMSAIYIRSVFPSAIPRSKMPQMFEMIARANYGLGVGCFEIDANDGELAFRTSILADPDASTPEVILERTLGVNLGTHAKYWPAFMQVLYANRDVKTALNTVEAPPSSDSGPLSDEAFAAYMKRMVGGASPGAVDTPEGAPASGYSFEEYDGGEGGIDEQLMWLEIAEDETLLDAASSDSALYLSDMDDDLLAKPGKSALDDGMDIWDESQLEDIAARMRELMRRQCLNSSGDVEDTGEEEEDEDEAILDQLLAIESELNGDPATRTKILKQIGHQLQRVRRKHNLSMAEIAYQLQVNPSTIRRWMHGGRVRSDRLSRLVLWLRLMGGRI